MTADEPERRVSTGVATLDECLGCLCWGDNVVWQLDGVASADFPDMETIGTELSGAPMAPGDLLREVRRSCDVRRRNLLLFDSLDAMVDAWGVELARWRSSARR